MLVGLGFYVCFGVFFFVFYMHILALLDFKTVKEVSNFLLAFYVLYVSVLWVVFCMNVNKHEIITFCLMRFLFALLAAVPLTGLLHWYHQETAQSFCSKMSASLGYFFNFFLFSNSGSEVQSCRALTTSALLLKLAGILICSTSSVFFCIRARTPATWRDEDPCSADLSPVVLPTFAVPSHHFIIP